VSATECRCATCGLTRSLANLDAAIDAVIDGATDDSMTLNWLRGEVFEAVTGPLSQVKPRLRRALEVARPTKTTATAGPNKTTAAGAQSRPTVPTL
jgi:hypothetical protein